MSEHKRHNHHKQQQALDSLYAHRQCRDDQDYDAASRLGCGADRGASRRDVQLRLDRREPIHVAKGNFGRDIWNELSRADHVRRGGHQEEIVLRLDQQ